MSDIEVLTSRVHGKGVFATRHLAAGVQVIEYVGEIISMAEAIARHPHDAASQRLQVDQPLVPPQLCA